MIEKITATTKILAYIAEAHLIDNDTENTQITTYPAMAAAIKNFVLGLYFESEDTFQEDKSLH